jgi:hypothetical protein
MPPKRNKPASKPKSAAVVYDWQDQDLSDFNEEQISVIAANLMWMQQLLLPPFARNARLRPLVLPLQCSPRCSEDLPEWPQSQTSLPRSTQLLSRPS